MKDDKTKRPSAQAIADQNWIKYLAKIDEARKAMDSAASDRAFDEYLQANKAAGIVAVGRGYRYEEGASR